MSLKSIAFQLIISASFATSAIALPPGPITGRLNSRAELEAVLGDSAVTETFETFQVPPNPLGMAGFFGPLTSNSIVRGQGPGLVKPGISFQVPSELQWYDTTAFGGNSKRLSFSSGDAYNISFDPPVHAFGIDFTAIPMTSGSSSLYVYDTTGDTVGRFEYGTVNDPQTPTFVGFAHPDGIGGIGILTFGGGPILDNFTFGRVPEPSGISIAALLGAAFFLRCRHLS
jgi:hypothetical protein